MTLVLSVRYRITISHLIASSIDLCNKENLSTRLKNFIRDKVNVIFSDDSFQALNIFCNFMFFFFYTFQFLINPTDDRNRVITNAR